MSTPKIRPSDYPFASTPNTPRTQALWMKHHAFSTEEEASEALCDFRDHGNALETELAAAQAECERLKFASEGHLLKTIQQQAELARLRAEVERLDAEKPWLKEANARAAHAEAALAEWSVLNLWGGTPEIIHEFIKAQQNRIHHCQNLEAEFLEQARLLGMSGEREADLLRKIERLAKDKARLDWLESPAGFDWQWNSPHSVIVRRAAIDAAMKP